MGNLFEREYYRVSAAAAELGCDVDDLIHWAATGRISLGVLYEIQWGKSYFGCVAGADLGYDLCIALEGPVNLRAMTTEISNKILVDNISQE